MDTSSLIWLAVALVAGGGAAWFGARWWFGRQFALLQAQADKAEKGRQVALQQSQQVRKQIDQLQKDLAALQVRRPAANAQPAAAAAAKGKAERMAEAEAMLAAATAASSASYASAPQNGFADTQPISRL